MTYDQTPLGRARKSYAKWRSRGEGRAFIAILFSMNEGICPRCGRKMYLAYGHEDGRSMNNARATLDHRVPLAVRPQHDKNNLDLCCYGCNHDKGMEQYAAETNKHGGRDI